MPKLWSKEAISEREGTTFQKKQLRRLQAQSRRTDPTIWIGKQGPSEKLTKQVVTQLKTRELVKLKMLKSALSDTEAVAVAEKVAASTGSTLVEVIGHTFALYKRRELTESGQSRQATKADRHFKAVAN
jgi:putative YhbY family RNA-binding protein